MTAPADTESLTLFDLTEPAAGETQPLVPSGSAGRLHANLAAVETLIRLLRDEETPTAADRDTLQAWSGWGAASEVFSPKRPGLQWARDKLTELLGPDGYTAASRSTLNAHYTDPAICQAMWAAAQQLGFETGTVLEPGCGSGNFITAAPPGARVTGYELDPTTASICATLHPDAEIWFGSFAAAPTHTLLDMAIGNVPFGDVRLHDPAHNQGRWRIHDHFIIKALHMIRPGGIMCVVTSRGTLDKRDSSARTYMAEVADLIGAVRLPETAHQRTAGTRVVSDILLLRRRPHGQPPAGLGWLQTRLVELDGREIPVNEYFLTHPGRVLGVMGARHGMHGEDSLTVRPNSDLHEVLPAALAHITAQARAAGLTHQPGDETPATAAAGVPAPGFEEGHIRDNGDWAFSIAENGRWMPYAVSGSQALELRHLLELRDITRQLLDAETATTDDTPHIAALRSMLNARYDAYTARWGYLGRFSLRHTGRTDPDTGEEKLARLFPRVARHFRRDPLAPLVYALEIFDPVEQTGTKAAIFTKRVVAPRKTVDNAAAPADALAICLDLHGRVHLPEIARLLSLSEDQAGEALGDLVFTDPGTGGLVAAAEYLSGPVRKKLKAAELAAADNPGLRRNVTALRDVIPQGLTPGEISARLGASWIDAKYIRQFFADLLDDPGVKVEHPGGQIWQVAGDENSVRATSTWGTGRKSAIAIAKCLLEQRPVTVQDLIKTPDGDKRILNVEETLLAAEKAEEIRHEFGEWIWKDPTRARDLAETYNDLFNGWALRNYDTAHEWMTLPGLSVAFHPHKHQYAAAARIINEPAALLAHEVGAGKTAEMVMGAMELRRLGLIRKPMIVVPNHMLEQFAGDFLRCYPLARILIARKEELQGENRRRFVARCATGDWDTIIISHSAFERIPLSKGAAETYIDTEIAKMRAWRQNAKSDSTVKRVERALLAAEERLRRKLAGRKDNGVTFENTGVDYVFVDEAHLFKNLMTASAIPDARIDGSMRATDLHVKLSWLRQQEGTRIATFATATPVANSMAELFVMKRYLRPDVLEDAGVDVFDVWAGTFGEMVTGIELAPEGGSSFRTKTRFARFHNVPEMLQMFWLFADVKTGEDLDLKVPQIAAREDGQREAEIIAVEPSESLEWYVQDLGERAEAIRLRQVVPEEDNMLKVCSDGRKAALHLDLVGLTQDTPGKIDVVAGKILEIWEETQDWQYPLPDGTDSPVLGALQLVFSDMGTPKPGQWSPYEQLRTLLVQGGIPREQVRFIHEAKNDRDKAMLFAAARAGHVAVLVGSTEKMGVGTNVQDRIIAQHDMDAPWRPADIAQRRGRTIRPGNLHRDFDVPVALFRYVVKRSFDAYMWQILERKARFIHQVMSGRLKAREVEDIGDTALSFAQVKALATDNPLLMDKAEADNDLAKLRRGRRAHNRNQDLLHSTIRHHGEKADAARQLILDVDAAIRHRDKTAAAPGPAATIDGTEHTDRAEAGKHLAEMLRDEVSACHASRWGSTAQGTRMRAGWLGGFELHAATRRQWGNVLIDLWLDGAPGTQFQIHPADIRPDRDQAPLIERLEKRLANMEHQVDEARDTIARSEKEIVRAEAEIGAPYPKQAELDKAARHVEEIDAELKRMAAERAKRDDAATKNLAGKPKEEPAAAAA